MTSVAPPRYVTVIDAGAWASLVSPVMTKCSSVALHSWPVSVDAFTWIVVPAASAVCAPVNANASDNATVAMIGPARRSGLNNLGLPLFRLRFLARAMAVL